MSHGELPEILYRQGIPTAFAGRSPGYFRRLDADAANFFFWSSRMVSTWTLRRLNLNFFSFSTATFTFAFSLAI